MSRIVAAVAAAALLLVAICSFFTTGLMENDDVVISAFASGAYGGKPTEHLVFVNVIPGWFLASAYRLLGGIPWYPVMLWTVQAIAWAAILWAGVFARRHRSPVRVVLTIAVVVFGAPRLAVLSTFTATGMLLGVAGVVLAAEAIDRSRRDALVLAVVGGLFLGSAALLRSDALVAVVVAFAPVLVVVGWRAGWRASAAFSVAALALVGTGALAQYVSLQNDPAWHRFTTYNSARGALHGTARLERTPALTRVMSRIGWTDDDLRLFERFVYADPRVFDAKSINAIRAATSAHLSVPPAAQTNRIVFRSYLAVPAAVFAFLVLVLLRLRARVAIGMVLAGVWFAAVLVGLFWLARFPAHVGWPLWIGALVFAAVLPDVVGPARPTLSRERQTGLLRCGALLLLVLTVASVRAANSLSSLNDGLHADLRRELATLYRVDPRGMFIARGSIVALTGADPFDAVGPYGHERGLVALGWPTFSPEYDARIARLGTADVLDRLLEQPRHTYFVAEPGYAVALSRSMHVHRGVDISFERVEPSGFASNIWRPVVHTAFTH